MKSWISTRRPACAPPPKIWISGSGITASAAVAEQIGIKRLACAAAAACSAAIDTATSALPPSRLFCGVPSSAISAPSIAAWSAASMPGQRGGDLAVDRGYRAAHVAPAEPRAAVAQARSPRRSRSRRRPARSPARQRRPPAAPRPRRSAGRANPRPGGRARATMRVSLMQLPLPRWPPRPRAPPRAFDRIEQQRPRDPPHPVLVGFERDIFDRRLAVDPRQQQPRQQVRGARFEHLRAAPMRRRRDRIRRDGRSRRENRRPPRRFHRHFSSRWLRQKARSKAGSPYQAHSASRNTGPRGPIRMFFGLTSPWTSARRVRAVVSASRPSGAARSGCARIAAIR